MDNVPKAFLSFGWEDDNIEVVRPSGGTTEYLLHFDVIADALRGAYVELGFGTGDRFVSAATIFPALDFDVPIPSAPAPTSDAFSTIVHQPYLIQYSGGTADGFVTNFASFSIDVPDLPLSVNNYYLPEELPSNLPAGAAVFTLRQREGFAVVPEPGSATVLPICGLLAGIGYRVRQRKLNGQRMWLLLLLPLMMTTTPARADLRDGLISYWPFDGNGTDASGSDRDLTLQGQVGFASGRFDQALDMHKNQNTYALRLVDDAAYDFGANNFTIQTWVQYYSTNTEQVLIDKYTGEGGWTLTKLDSNAYRFHADSAFTTPSQTIATNVWHHLISRRSSGQLQIWRNGSSILTASIGTIANSAEPLHIGRRNPVELRDFSMNGRLDEVAIWNRALTDNEIAFLYNGGLGNPVIPVPEPSATVFVVCALLGLLSHNAHRRVPGTVC
jgi:hypothetical protein